MTAIPKGTRQFAQLLEALFAGPDMPPVTIRTSVPNSKAAEPALSISHPALSIAYLADLADPAGLQQFVFAPLAAGGPLDSPAQLADPLRFPMLDQQPVQEAAALTAGLLEGLAAIHLDGSGAAVLVSTGALPDKAAQFTESLNLNRALLARMLRSGSLRLRNLPGKDSGRATVSYLADKVDPGIVDAVCEWASDLLPGGPGLTKWRAVERALRLPPVVEWSAPAAVAEAMRRGYVAVLVDQMPRGLVGPATIDLMLEGPGDMLLLPPVRRLLFISRLAAAVFSITLAAGFVAIASYHHALLPGPFLTALSVGMQNRPFPIVIDVLLTELLDDTLAAATARTAGPKWLPLGLFGTLIGAIAVFQSELLSAIPAMVAVAGSMAFGLLPNGGVAQRLRFWRFFFTMAAIGLGMEGISLLFFALIVYLGEERHFGHPMREELKAVKPWQANV